MATMLCCPIGISKAPFALLPTSPQTKPRRVIMDVEYTIHTESKLIALALAAVCRIRDTANMGEVLDSRFLALTAIITIGYQFTFFAISYGAFCFSANPTLPSLYACPLT
jgi:hypothetical protein